MADILRAARAGDLSALRDAIKRGADVNSVEDGWTPLTSAAFNGHTNCIRELLSSGAVVDLADMDGRTPLMEAARGGHTDSVRQLLSSGAVVDLADKNGRTPLYWAASKVHTDCIKELLSSGAVVDLADKTGYTPLIMAASEGHTDSVRQLLSSGAVVDLASKDGWTPLYWAAYKGHTDCVRQLLSSGAVVDLANKRGQTPLMSAAKYGHADSVRELLSSGAVVDLASKYGWTPLYWAASEGHTDCIKELLSSGAVVDLANKDGDTPLMWAAYWGREDAVKELLSAGASPLCTNNNGETALMRAKKSPYSSPLAGKLLEEATESHSCSQHVPVLPKNWTVATDTEMKKPVYQNKAAGETLSTPPGYPLHQTSAHPDVTFYGEPQEKEFTSSGGHADFDNGVEVTVPANAVPAGTSVGIKVQPSLAPRDVFMMPEGIQSASPSYLISGEGLTGEVTLSMEHHVRVSTQQEADDLLFLQADSSPKRSGSHSVYEYQVSEGRSKFTPGGNTGRLTLGTRLKNFFKIGQRRKKGKADSNLYTVRVYRSPPHTTGDRMALVIVSYFNRLFLDFLQRFEVVVIPREYPHLSSSPADKTIKQPLCFVQVDAVLELVCDPAWRSVPDQRMISQKEVDLPVIGQFLPEELQCYPPRIVCRFFPEQGAVSCTTCTLSLLGFDQPVSVDMALLTPQRSVDTKQLKDHDTVREEVSSKLGPSAKRVTLQELVEQYNLTDEQLNSEIEVPDTPELALCFDDVELYSSAMGLAIAEQADVNQSRGTQAAMMKCLQIWKQHNPSQATYRALLDIALRLGKGDTAHQICQQLTQRGVSGVVTGSDCIQVEASVARNVPTVAWTVVDINEATEVLRRTVGEMTTSQLGSTVETVLSLMEKMTIALQSSSLSELTGHTDSIRTNVRSIRRLARKIVKECNIGASLSKMETLSHKLGRLTEDKLGDCQGLAESVQTLPRTIDGKLT
ncbi:uncharacterized protein LOC135334127 isoform X2 [Halichondria panicea]|uniref:uncharacterized protein LOC135334127 isoform X2 n=1 Tax=Halichondria panicea TaxID=6063 RepID=UPI00312B5253